MVRERIRINYYFYSIIILFLLSYDILKTIATGNTDYTFLNNTQIISESAIEKTNVNTKPIVNESLSEEDLGDNSIYNLNDSIISNYFTIISIMIGIASFLLGFYYNLKLTGADTTDTDIYFKIILSLIISIILLIIYILVSSIILNQFNVHNMVLFIALLIVSAIILYLLYKKNII